MAFSDLGRWWFRPGEIVAMLKVGDERVALVFTYDAGSLWGFELGDGKPIYDHTAGHLAYGLDRDDRALCDAFRVEMEKLTGGREHWAVSRGEQAILDILAKELPKGLDISGKRLRQQLGRDHNIGPDEAAHLLGRLQPRYVFRIDGDGDFYRLTLPGLLQSCEKEQAKTVIVWTLTALALAFEKDPDVATFTTDEVMRAPGFTSEDARFWCHVIVIARLGSNAEATLPGGYHLRVPADIERLVQCKDMAGFWKATIDGPDAERPWPTAPLRPKPRRPSVHAPSPQTAPLDPEVAKYVDEQGREIGSDLDRISRAAVAVPEPARRSAPRAPNPRPVPVSETTAANPPSESMLVKLAKEVAKALRPEPQASIGFGLIQDTYYDEKTGTLMAKVVPDPSRPGKVSIGTFQPGSPPRKRNMKYDAALSFAGEDRHYAEELKTIVKKAGFEIFYDNDEESELWGENVYDVLYDVYANQSRFVVMFVSEHYARKEWTTHERQAAQSTALKKKGKAYILPVYIDNTQLPGLHGTIGRQDIKKGIPHIARMLIQKLEKPAT